MNIDWRSNHWPFYASFPTRHLWYCMIWLDPQEKDIQSQSVASQPSYCTSKVTCAVPVCTIWAINLIESTWGHPVVKKPGGSRTRILSVLQATTQYLHQSSMRSKIGKKIMLWILIFLEQNRHLFHWNKRHTCCEFFLDSLAKLCTNEWDGVSLFTGNFYFIFWNLDFTGNLVGSCAVLWRV